MSQANRRILLIVLVLGILIYLPSLFNYFSTDDWFLLRISRFKSWSQIADFFSFYRNQHSAAFYRPVSQQLFLSIFQFFFGINPLPYHVLGLIFFGFSGYLVYLIGKLIGLTSRQSIISTTIYMISSANFPRIYFISAYQDIFFPLISLMAIYYFIKDKTIIAYILFIVSLGTKESAVVLPALFILFDWYFKKIDFRKYIVPFFITAIYLWFRLIIFGGAQGDSYIWDFSLKKAANSLMWYGFWSVGLPEIMVDYVGSGLEILPKFFIELKISAWILLVSFFTTIAAVTGLLAISFKRKKLSYRLIVMGAIFFVFTLATVLFLPWHKFSHHLGLPLAGFAWIISSLIISNNRKINAILFLAFLILNFQSHVILYQRHYSTTRALISKRVADYLDVKFNNYPNEKPLLFVNDTDNYDLNWGYSKQVAFALSGSEFFKVYYKDNGIKVYYEDFDQEMPNFVTKISSGQFLK